MNISELFLSQFQAYGIFGWIIFVGVSFLLPYRFGWRAIFLAHLAVACFVIYSDFQWIGTEMKKPDWDGRPDMDIVFSLGLLFRVVVLNILLLPLALLALWIRKPKTEA